MNRTLTYWLLGLLLLAVAVPTTAGFLIAVGLAGMAVVLGIWTWLAHRGIAVEVVIPDRLVQGEVTAMNVTVANHSRLPAPRVRVEVRLPEGRLLPGETVLELALPGRSKVRRDVEVTAYVRGQWSPPPVSVAVSDPWGLWLRTSEAPGAPTVVVLPALVPVRRADLPAVSPLAEVPDRRALTTDPTAIVGVRPYRPGDPLRTIHWPATAASGTLVRRETERAWARDLVVVLDLNHDAWDRFDDKPVEIAISTAASLLANAILHLRQPAGLVVSMPDRAGSQGERDRRASSMHPAARFRVGASRGHLDAMLVHLAAVQRHRGAPLAELLLREAATRQPGTTLAVVGPAANDEVLAAVAAARRSGLAPMLLEVGPRQTTASVAGVPTGRRLPRFAVSTEQPIGSTQL